jgi:hypothetical protein
MRSKNMDRKELIEFFNKRPRNCLISTANNRGESNISVYGTPKMLDENTMVMAARDNRTYRNLKQNPKAAVMVVEPGEIKHQTKAVRIYLEVISIETEGELLQKFKKEVAERTGQKVADALRAAIRFEVTEVRPLIDPLD